MIVEQWEVGLSTFGPTDELPAAPDEFTKNNTCSETTAQLTGRLAKQVQNEAQPQDKRTVFSTIASLMGIGGAIGLGIAMGAPFQGITHLARHGAMVGSLGLGLIGAGSFASLESGIVRQLGAGLAGGILGACAGILSGVPLAIVGVNAAHLGAGVLGYVGAGAALGALVSPIALARPKPDSQ